MNPYSIPSLMCLLTIPVLGVYIFSRNSKSELHRFFLVLTAGITFWAFTEFNIRQAESFANALFWIRVRAFRMLLSPILVHFLLIYINKWKEYNKPKAFFLTYSFVLFMVLTDLFFGVLSGVPVKTEWGWSAGKPLWPIISLFYLIWNLVAVVVIVKGALAFVKMSNPEERKSFYLLFWGLFIGMMSGATSGIVAALMKPGFSEFSIITAFLLVSYVAFVIWKYNLLISSTDTAENVLELMGDGLVISGVRNEIVRVNQALLRLSGYRQEELIGKDIALLFNSDAIGICKPCDDKRRPHETLLIPKEGRNVPILLSQAAILNNNNVSAATVSIVKDLTIWKKAQQEIVHAEKLEAFELIIRSITHDFNNLLTAICGNLCVVENSNKLHESLKENVETAVKAALIAANLTKRLASYAKEDVFNTTLCSIKEIIGEAKEITLKGSDITFNHHSEKNLWMVQIDRYRMIQVFVNLFINARQAMTNKGTITVHCLNKVNEDQYNEVIEVSVTDDGPGIPSHIVDRVFDPFFTTKEKGSGLGLSIVKNIVIAHHGSISTAKNPGGGTTFILQLPKKVSISDTTLSKSNSAQSILPKKILIMDDEESVQMVLSMILNQMGHKVTSCKDGEEAFSHFLGAYKNRIPYDCILLDLNVVEGIGAVQTVKRILKIDSSVRVILTSGYTSDPVIENFEAYGFDAFLKKPFCFTEVNNALSEVFRTCTVA